MENPDSRESFKYFKLSMRISGTYPPKRFRNIYRFYGAVYYVNVLILFPLSLIVKLWFVDNKKEMFKNFSWCLIIVATSITFLALFSAFQNLHRNSKLILGKMDKRLLSAEEKGLIRSVINFNQTIHLTYFGLCFVMFTLLFAYPLIAENQLIFPAWFPLTDNFFIAFGYQSVSLFMAMLTNITTIMIPVINITVLTAHTRALSMRVQLIGNDADKTPEENHTELVNCIEDQGNLNKYFVDITQIISRSIFIQFVMTAFITGIGIVNFIYFSETLMEKITAVGFLCTVLSVVLPCCYLCEEYTNAADYLTTAIFSCNWMDQNPKVKKAIIIFMQHSQKSNVMLAAKLIPVSLHSFLMLLKFSFSLFTVLSQLNS